MRKGYLRNVSAVPFALAGALAVGGALFPASQALAGDTSVTLGDGDTATVQGGGTKVETDADGNVKVYVNGDGNVTVYADEGITVRPAANDTGAAVLKAGDTLADGTIYAGNNFAATPADAPSTYTWLDGKRYCEDLEAHGHDDWTLPTRDQLNHLYQNKNTGSFAGTFNETGSIPASWYWSSTEDPDVPIIAWDQRFNDNLQGWSWKRSQSSVRCVRSLPRRNPA